MIAAAVVLTSVSPASAAPSGTPDLPGIPAALDAELSADEKQTLAALTDGDGVALEAFVVTPDGAEIVSLDAESRADAEAATDVLEAQPSVESAALTVRVSATAGALAQYGNTMIRSGDALAAVDNPLSGVVVAVLDTGVAPHAELAGALVPGQNFTDSPGGATGTGDVHGHGTHVAGTVGADAGSQVEGVAPGVRIMPVKVLGDDGNGYSNWTNSGIIWAADNGADVINMSLGGYGGAGVYASAVSYARSRGVTVIAAAGNDNVSTPHYPSGEPGVISVAAVDTARQKASFSNYGPTVDVAAPGVSITSTDRSGGFSSKSGTSMAAPHVAGVAALVKAAAPALTPDEVEQALLAGVSDLGVTGRDDVFGHGLVDALRSVEAANAMEVPLPPTEQAADLVVTHRLGPDMPIFWRIPLSQLDGDYGRPQHLTTLLEGGFTYEYSRTVAGNVGDVTGSDDGTPDQVIWHAIPNGGVIVWAVGGGPDRTPRFMHLLHTDGWSWANSVPMMGDVTGDGFDDLVVRHANGPTSSIVWVFPSDGQRLGAPQVWGRTEGLARRSLLIDTDADGRQDLLVARPSSGTSGLTYDVLGANTSGTAFDGFSRAAFSGPGAEGWSESASRTLAADVTGDGRSDIVTVHANGVGLLVWVHRNCAYVPRSACFEPPVVWQALGTDGWSYTGSRQYLADTDGDGAADLVSAHAQAADGILLFRHRSSTAAFAPPEVFADLRTGGWSFSRSRGTAA